MKSVLLFLIFVSDLFSALAQEKIGAAFPWNTYESEQMHTNGTILGPGYQPGTVEVESSGQRCVRLSGKNQFVEFAAGAAANSMVIRYSIPDVSEKGWWSELGIYINGRKMRRCLLTARYAWLYGKYPFSNDPQAGNPRHFYDEARVGGLKIRKGDRIEVRPTGSGKDTEGYCILDLIDLEMAPPPTKRPAHSLSITKFADAGSGDYTAALRNCIARAIETRQKVWIPAGVYKITGDIIIPAHATIQGAGIWYTELTGNDSAYGNAGRRVRLKGNGDSIRLSDIAIRGRLNYRSDDEANDGIVGSFGTGSAISRVWIEHTKVGMWIENSRELRVTDCRIRNTMADGINFCIGMSKSIIENCTARGTGDDCFALWPAAFRKQEFMPANNLIAHCTGQLPYLANGAAIYGGESNCVRDCAFIDISQGSAILISTTFPTAGKDDSPDNNFSGTTVVNNCFITHSGGFDHEWGWRSAIEICLDRRSIRGVKIGKVRIDSSLSNAVGIVEGKNGDAVLSEARLERCVLSGVGIGTKAGHGIFIAGGAKGGLVVDGVDGEDVENRADGFYLGGKGE